MVEWYHTAIPKSLAERIKKIHAVLGWTTIGSFIAEAVREKLDEEESRYGEIEHEREVGREVLGKNPDKKDW